MRKAVYRSDAGDHKWRFFHRIGIVRFLQPEIEYFLDQNVRAQRRQFERFIREGAQAQDGYSYPNDVLFKPRTDETTIWCCTNTVWPMLATTPRLCVVRTSLSGLLWWKHTISISKRLDTTTDLVMTSSQAGDILISTIPLDTVRRGTSGNSNVVHATTARFMQESY
jgi:hypothetical protein